MRVGRVIGILVVLALLGSGVWAWRAFAPRQAPRKIPTASPSRGEFVVSLQADGKLQSDDAVVVRNGEAGGKITVIVPDGAIVKQGDVFCRIESREIEQRKAELELSAKQAREEIEKTREAAQQDYDNARHAVEQARESLRLREESNQVQIQQKADKVEFDRAEEERLRVEYERSKRLADKGYVPGTEAEIAKATYEAQRFSVEQSAKELLKVRRQIASEKRQQQTVVQAAERKAEVAQTRIEEQAKAAQERAEQAGRELEKVMESLRNTTVLAPASGVVTLDTTYVGGGERRAWKAGDQAQPREHLGNISGTENMSLACRIRESNIASVWKGQKTEIEFEALPGRRFGGAVFTVGAVAREVWIFEDPKAEPNVRVFDVWVKVGQGQTGRLKPGLNGKVAFIVKRVPKAVYVPLEAVFERAGKSLVYVKRGDRFVPREVNVGERNDMAVVVRSGLAKNEVVAMTDPTRRPVQQAKGPE